MNLLEVTQLVSGGIRLPIISFASLWLNPFSEESTDFSLFHLQTCSNSARSF